MYMTHLLFESFILYRMEADGQFYYFKEFSDFDNLINYFADSELSDLNMIGNGTLNDISYTPHDSGAFTGKNVNCEKTDLYIVTDKKGYIVHPADFVNEINQKREEIAYIKSTYRQHKPKPFKSRRNPVAGTGISYKRYYRTVAHWTQGFRFGWIPEYRIYSRKRAVPFDVMDEPSFKTHYRSWKHNTKKCHQWE